jgi:hypothetical protein
MIRHKRELIRVLCQKGFILKTGPNVFPFQLEFDLGFLFDPYPGLIQEGIMFPILNHYTADRQEVA